MKNMAKADKALRMAAVWGERAIRKGVMAKYGEAIGDPFQAYWRARLAFRAAFRAVGR